MYVVLFFRFLSSGLITYDILAVSFFTIRKFVSNHSFNILTQVVGVSFCFNAYVTIGLMSLERYILFRFPNFYIRNFTCKKVKSVTFVVWLISFGVYFYVRLGVCFTFSQGISLYDVIGKCNRETFIMYSVTIVVVIVISFTCYWKIFQIVKSDHTTYISAKSLHQYRSTSLVFVYVVTLTMTTAGYIIVIGCDLERIALRLSNDLVNTFNSMVDPFVYVLWFRECRMEMIKMFVCGSKKWKNRVENMRLEIFDVVTSEVAKSFNRNSEVEVNYSLHI